MFLKVVFVCLLSVVVGLLWQYEEYRRMLWLELDRARLSINSSTARFEGWQLLFLSCGLTIIAIKVLSCLFDENMYTLRERIGKAFFSTVRSAPVFGGMIKKEVAKSIAQMEKGFASKPGETYRMELSKKGLSQEKVLSEMEKLDQLASTEWDKGWVSGALYYSSPELTGLTTEVFRRYVWSNPLHSDLFPQVRKMEAEVIQWTVNLFNGGSEGCGLMTSGGTESIMMAMRAYREAGYARGIKYPEIVMPETAHCAFNKAAEYFRMKLTLVRTDPKTHMVDLKAMARAISSNTVVLVGSAPQFPHGIIDPIPAIAALARQHGSGNIGVHVDCCLGGFILAFMEKAGYDIEPFDFRVPGVTSISADTHKYGYTPKGSSVVMYSNKKLRQQQYFVAPNWPGGIYATAGAPGSRPGCLIATTWATMMHMGEDGYVDACRRIIETTRVIVAGLREIPGIKIMGEPKAMVLAFESSKACILRLSDSLREKGWSLNLLQYPPSIHLCVTMVHTKEGVVERFIGDVRSCTEEILRTPDKKASGSAAFYGQAADIPDRSIVNELCKEFLDMTYRATPIKS